MTRKHTFKRTGVLPVLVKAIPSTDTRCRGAGVVHFGVKPGELAGCVSRRQPPPCWADRVGGSTSARWVRNSAFSRCDGGPVVEVTIVGSVCSGVSRHRAEGIGGVIVRGRAGTEDLRQSEAAGYVTVAWSQGKGSAGRAELEVVQHPAVAVGKLGYLVGSVVCLGGTSWILQGDDGFFVAAGKGSESLALAGGEGLHGGSYFSSALSGVSRTGTGRYGAVLSDVMWRDVGVGVARKGGETESSAVTGVLEGGGVAGLYFTGEVRVWIGAIVCV